MSGDTSNSFDYLEFYDLTDDIEKYLGYLKGNEAVRDYADLVKDDVPPGVDVYDCSLEWTDWQSQADYSPLITRIWYPIPFDEFQNDDQARLHYLQQIDKNCNTAFDNGKAWAAGIGGYIRDRFSAITRVEATSLTDVVNRFASLSIKLESVIPPLWDQFGDNFLNFKSWNGTAAEAYDGVREHIQTVFHDQYALYFAHASALFGGAAALAIQTQKGINPMLTDVRDEIKSQLVRWYECGGRPEDVGPMSPKVADVVDLADTISSHIPVVSDVVGGAKDVAKAAQDIAKICGTSIDLNPLPTPFDAKSSAEIYEGLMSTINNQYLTPLQNGLDGINAKQGTAAKNAAAQVQPWKLATLDSVKNLPVTRVG